MTRLSSNTWRRRALAAEARASTAEHLLRLARRRAKLWRERALMLCDDDRVSADTLQHALKALSKLARLHLGDDAMESEVGALVEKWMHAPRPKVWAPGEDD